MNLMQTINSIINNKTNNPIIKNAIELYTTGNEKDLYALAERLCKEKGTTLDEVCASINQLR